MTTTGQLGIDTSDLVDALLGIVRKPMQPRVRVTPNGPAEVVDGILEPYLRCEAGFTVTCSACGELDTFGAAFLDIAVDMSANQHNPTKHGEVTA